MEIDLKIKMNEGLFLRNPEDSELGKKIIKHSIQLIHASGLESFTFKKLAVDIGTTEAGIYRYFENKHRLLLYIATWYWHWLAFKISYQTNNIKDPKVRLKMAIKLLASTVEDDITTQHINEKLLHHIIISEGSKAYLTKQVGDDNKNKFFQPYKELCASIGDIILQCNPKYKYPKSLASTIIEVAHIQNFFMHNLSSLTDFVKKNDESQIIEYLNDLVFSSLKMNK